MIHLRSVWEDDESHASWMSPGFEENDDPEVHCCCSRTRDYTLGRDQFHIVSYHPPGEVIRSRSIIGPPTDRNLTTGEQAVLPCLCSLDRDRGARRDAARVVSLLCHMVIRDRSVGRPTDRDLTTAPDDKKIIWNHSLTRV